MPQLTICAADVKANITRFLDGVKVPVIGVVKGNGYGLGLLPLARMLIDCGVSMLGVDDLGEAASLRQNGFDQPLLLFKPLCQTEDAQEALALGVQPFVGNLHTLALLEQAAAQADTTAQAHLFLDTGFGGYGFDAQNMQGWMQNLQSPYVTFVGTATHFAASFGAEQGVRNQHQRFRGAVTLLQAQGFSTGMLHVCNSHAAVRFADLHEDAVRVGSVFAGRLGHGYSPVGRLQSRILAVHTLEKGRRIGYGGVAVMPRDGLLGIADIGYAQGLAAQKRPDALRPVDRLRTIKASWQQKPLSGQLAHGKATVLGRVNMNHTALLCPPGTQPEDEIVFDCNPLFVPQSVERVWH